jgi:hypothetical protein
VSDRPQPWQTDASVAERTRQLRSERRSFVTGSILVLFVTKMAIATLAAIILSPAIHRAPEPQTFSAMLERMRQSFAVLALHPPITLVAVELVAVLALFVLNYRYSSLIRRPRWAFGPSAGSGGRLMWATLLLINSLVYDSFFLLPEIVLVVLLARWGQEGIAATARVHTS